MHDLLKNYVVKGLSYIERDELVKILKQADNSYYIDDLNYLTAPSVIDGLYGYLPGTTPSRNFCYTRLLNIMRNSKLPIPKECVISCRDVNVLELYLSLFFKNRVFEKFSLNVPIRFDDTEQPTEKIVPKLLEQYDGYYKVSSYMFDYRFQDARSFFAGDKVGLYEIVSTPQDIFGDNVPVYNDWYVLKKYDNPIFAYGCSLYYDLEKIGVKCFSFGNHFYTYEDKTIVTEDVIYLWRYLAKKYANEGYIVKAIAIDDGFDNDEMYKRMGMERYRCFIKMKTENGNNT